MAEQPKLKASEIKAYLQSVPETSAGKENKLRNTDQAIGWLKGEIRRLMSENSELSSDQALHQIVESERQKEELRIKTVDVSIHLHKVRHGGGLAQFTDKWVASVSTDDPLLATSKDGRLVADTEQELSTYLNKYIDSYREKGYIPKVNFDSTKGATPSSVPMDDAYKQRIQEAVTTHLAVPLEESSTVPAPPEKPGFTPDTPTPAFQSLATDPLITPGSPSTAAPSGTEAAQSGWSTLPGMESTPAAPTPPTIPKTPAAPAPPSILRKPGWSGLESPGEVIAPPAPEAAPPVPENEEVEEDWSKVAESLYFGKPHTVVSEKLQSAAQTVEVWDVTNKVWVAAPKLESTFSSDNEAARDVTVSRLNFVQDGQPVTIETAGFPSGSTASEDSIGLGQLELRSGKKFVIAIDADGVTNGLFGAVASRFLVEQSLKILEQQQFDSEQEALQHWEKELEKQVDAFWPKYVDFLEQKRSELMSKNPRTTKESKLMRAIQNVTEKTEKYATLTNGFLFRMKHAQEKKPILFSGSMLTLSLIDLKEKKVTVVKKGDSYVTIDGQVPSGIDNSGGAINLTYSPDSVHQTQQDELRKFRGLSLANQAKTFDFSQRLVLASDVVDKVRGADKHFLSGYESLTGVAEKYSNPKQDRADDGSFIRVVMG